jgi:hypothetical protein
MDRWSDMSDCPNCGYDLDNPGEDEFHLEFLPHGNEQLCEIWVVTAKKGEAPWMKSSCVRDVRN